MYRAEKVTTSKRTQFQVHLNSARQAATKWSEADRDRAIERLEHGIHQMTPVKGKLFNQLLQNHEQQLFQEVETLATGPKSTFAKKLAQMKTAAEDKVYGAVYMIADKCVEFSSVYPMLRLKPPPGVWLIRTAL